MNPSTQCGHAAEPLQRGLLKHLCVGASVAIKVVLTDLGRFLFKVSIFVVTIPQLRQYHYCVIAAANDVQGKILHDTANFCLYLSEVKRQTGDC